MKQDLTVLATTGQPSSTQPYANTALERQLKEHQEQQKGAQCTR